MLGRMEIRDVRTIQTVGHLSANRTSQYWHDSPRIKTKSCATEGSCQQGVACLAWPTLSIFSLRAWATALCPSSSASASCLRRAISSELRTPAGCRMRSMSRLQSTAQSCSLFDYIIRKQGCLSLNIQVSFRPVGSVTSQVPAAHPRCKYKCCKGGKYRVARAPVAHLNTTHPTEQQISNNRQSLQLKADRKAAFQYV